MISPKHVARLFRAQLYLARLFVEKFLLKFEIASFRLEKTHVRRGAAFLINIGIPVTFAAATGHSRAALLAGVAALVLSFADNERGLLARLGLLTSAAACMAVGGTAGYLLSGKPAIFWPVFVVLVFMVGMAARAGREPMMALRYGAIAFTSTASLPIFDLHDARLLGIVLAVTITSRIIDHLIFGPLPRSTAGPQPQRPDSHMGWIRFALAYATASAGALWIGLTLEPLRAVWVVTTTLIVMQPDARASYQRIVERILGTFAGVLVAWLVASLVAKASATSTASMISEPWALCVIALVAAPFIPHHVGQRYWLHTALIAFFILLMYGYAAPSISELDTLLGERLKDMLLGCAVAVAGTAIAFPRRLDAGTGDEAGDT